MKEVPGDFVSSSLTFGLEKIFSATLTKPGARKDPPPRPTINQRSVKYWKIHAKQQATNSKNQSKPITSLTPLKYPESMSKYTEAQVLILIFIQIVIEIHIYLVIHNVMHSSHPFVMDTTFH